AGGARRRRAAALGRATGRARRPARTGRVVGPGWLRDRPRAPPRLAPVRVDAQPALRNRVAAAERRVAVPLRRRDDHGPIRLAEPRAPPAERAVRDDMVAARGHQPHVGCRIAGGYDLAVEPVAAPLGIVREDDDARLANAFADERERLLVVHG